MSLRSLCVCWMLVGGLSPVSDAIAEKPTRLNRTIQTLESGAPAFGIFSGDFLLANARSLAHSELDYIFIDMEHSYYFYQRVTGADRAAPPGLL